MWWRSTRRTHGRITDWARFKELFYKQYFSKAVKDLKRKEFTDLVQGTRNVLEYESKFIKLSVFALDYISTEEAKTTRFVEGLNESIQKIVAATTPSTYSEAVKRAQECEAAENRARANPRLTISCQSA